MAKTHFHSHHLHVSVPHVHVHSPHVDWHEIEHPARALMAASIGVFTLAVAGTVAQDAPQLLQRATPIAQGAMNHMDLTRHYRPEQGRSANVEHMYGGNTEPYSVQGMYAKSPTLRY